jgi:excinuclease UvrABC nuclease subunit
MTPQEDEKKYQIALSLIDGVGDIVGKKLLAQFGSAKGMFFAKKKELQKMHGSRTNLSWCNCLRIRMEFFKSSK